ncbi:BTAD domain-containing putative transcriptional regulator [Streptomyces sp. DSM 44915]|uniref:BTAD domain-containing putative transcriptional regulator n=1 Tax=Streptomyces chisholmiae TaxID=3075540 RepID=A0ABU2JRT2_9ACTN|nr:BTAD domain-containing putative transcriptional regulator [Streptomyces sp. DSM 44915]MDT0267691.1 BTAD domain-containing putative transcriptional regulator [Streptomyces sp. DSM 44915]
MRFQILGPLRIRCDHRWHPIGSGRQRHLLAILLARRNIVLPVPRLVEELWRTEPPETAHALVDDYAMRLRRLVGDEHGTVIERQPSGYRLVTASDDTDADLFVAALGSGVAALEDGERSAARGQLRGALALWRGEVLADVPATGLLAPTRASLTEAREVARDRLIETELTRDAAAVVPELRSLVGDDCLRERRWAQLMRALWLTGRQDEALSCYRQFSAVLRERRGTEPGPELADLRLRMLRA